ncbi:MAG TPA: HEAT repeat domain-containing protein [Pyrinomonadaceae bacterium]|jgi:HEAT repeat protein
MKKKLASKPGKDVHLRGQGKSTSKYIEEAYSPVVKSGVRNQADLNQIEEERWRREQAILRRAAENHARRRNETKVAQPSSVRVTSFDHLTETLEDPSPQVRNEAVRLLYELDPDRAASFFNIALREGSPAERRDIGAALAGSGLVDEAIEDLMGDSPENSYSAFSFLFLVAKAGEVQPLVQVIRNHPSIELRLTVIKLLASSGDPEIIPAFRRLTTSSLPAEVRTAILEAINQLGSQSSKVAHSAA